jgi:hypothetical protein
MVGQGEGMSAEHGAIDEPMKAQIGPQPILFDRRRL